MLFKILNCDTIIAPVVGDKCLCLTYYVHLAGIKKRLTIRMYGVENFRQMIQKLRATVRQTLDKILTIPTHIIKTGIWTVFENNLDVLILC